MDTAILSFAAATGCTDFSPWSPVTSQRSGLFVASAGPNGHLRYNAMDTFSDFPTRMPRATDFKPSDAPPLTSGQFTGLPMCASPIATNSPVHTYNPYDSYGSPVSPACTETSPSETNIPPSPFAASPLHRTFSWDTDDSVNGRVSPMSTMFSPLYGTYGEGPSDGKVSPLLSSFGTPYLKQGHPTNTAPPSTALSFAISGQTCRPQSSAAQFPSVHSPNPSIKSLSAAYDGYSSGGSVSPTGNAYLRYNQGSAPYEVYDDSGYARYSKSLVKIRRSLLEESQSTKWTEALKNGLDRFTNTAVSYFKRGQE